METKPAQNIQDSFLNNARRDRAAVTIYLVSGVKLTGRIKSFDKYSVVLDTSNNQEQLIFKHAISTVVTSKAAQGAHSERVAGSAGNASHPAGEPATSHGGESQG
jgi:host factor-I protein